MAEPDQSALVDKMNREADASDDLAKRYRHDAELHTQYSTEARTWRSAARMVKRAFDEEGA